MNQYDFGSLSDKEFEVLSNDLISAHLSTSFERFKPGKDRGVDGRFFSADGATVILQCKHWRKSSLTSLIKYLGETERKKVDKLSPSRYILTISHELSAANKKAILDAMAPHIKSPSDIHGVESLNDILASNRQIEQKHFKLWITSTNTLAYFLNKDVLDRSKFKAEEIKSQSKYYAPTTNHDKARNLLQSRRVAIITGQPGIGKTTLAENLALEAMAQGYEFIEIAEDIAEAEKVIQEDSKQIFYYDDFLGSNYADALSGNQGAHISQFIKRIQRDPSKRFILTSRTNILNQRRIFISSLNTAEVARSEFEITLDSLTSMDKARILYNHIWHSDLEDAYIEEIYTNKRYRKIVNHKNFNPRLIEFITIAHNSTSVDASDFWAHIEAALSNPSQVWQHPFEAQLDDFGRAIVLLIALNGKSSTEASISTAFSQLLQLPQNASLQGRRDFTINVKHLTRSLISRTSREGQPTSLSLFNPSIGDFILNRYKDDVASLQSTAASLCSTGCMETLITMHANGVLSSGNLEAITRSLLDGSIRAIDVFPTAFVAKVCLAYRMATKHHSAMPIFVERAAQKVLSPPYQYNTKDGLALLEWGFPSIAIPAAIATEVIKHECAHSDSEDFVTISRIRAQMAPVDRDQLERHVYSSAIDFLTEQARDEFEASDVFSYVSFGDIEKAEINLRELIEAKLNDFEVSFDDDDINQILDAYNVESQMPDHFYDGISSDHEESMTNYWADDIDDLFERSL